MLKFVIRRPKNPYNLQNVKHVKDALTLIYHNCSLNNLFADHQALSGIFLKVN